MELVERVAKLEEFAVDARDRLVRIETRLDTFSTTFATKEDISKTERILRVELHKELSNLTWKLLGGASALVAAVYFIAKHSS